MRCRSLLRACTVDPWRSAGWLVPFLALVLPAFNDSLAAPAPARPNIIFILADDLGWADLGCYGSSFYQTPNLDRLAREGTRFTQAYAAAPVCSPSRASLLTGQYPARLKLTDWLPGRPRQHFEKLSAPGVAQELPATAPSLARSLKTAGYQTALIGKWHLGGADCTPTAFGFDFQLAGNAQSNPFAYVSPGSNETSPLPAGEDLAGELTAAAERFIETNRARPFFLLLSHYAVHIPLSAKPALIEKYQKLAKPGARQTNAVYAALLEDLDENVGRIRRKLEALRLDRSTIVIFSSDNGGLSAVEGPITPATSNGVLREGKGHLYEGGLRVPLIVWAPESVRSGVMLDSPVIGEDLFPTILELAGSRAPSNDGRSFADLLARPGKLAERALYWHYPHYSNQGGGPAGAVRQGSFKLIEFFEDHRFELYDLRNDPGEMANLAEKLPERAAGLKQQLQEWRRQMNASMPAPNPDYREGAPAAHARPATQLEDGAIILHASEALIHGTTVRYEPQPNKNTLGYWTQVDDWVAWNFRVVRPGRFDVELLQGCGTGSGGSEVAITVDEQKLTAQVQETGGFQNFISRTIGRVQIEGPGTYTCSVKPIRKPGLAVMDLRMVTLRPAP